MYVSVEIDCFYISILAKLDRDQTGIDVCFYLVNILQLSKHTCPVAATCPDIPMCIGNLGSAGLK